MTTETASKDCNSPQRKPALASRIKNLHGSALRNLFSVIKNDQVISFAGGLPATETFPDLSSVTLQSSSLQYGASEGDSALRELIAARLTASGLNTSSDRIILLSGSQQGIDLVAKLLIQRGTLVGIESPTYPAALQVFDLYGAAYRCFSPGNAASIFTDTSADLLYTVPTFQNPSGFTYTTLQREKLAALCDNNQTVLFEDDPYRALSFDTCDRTPICSYLKQADWIYQSSFSKTTAPGLRIGYLTCSESLYEHLLHLKQAADLHSCRISQQVLIQLLQQGREEKKLGGLIDIYRKKRNFFHSVLLEHFTGLADWDMPAGGFFFWLTLKPHINMSTTQLFELAMKKNVAVMPSEFFYPSEYAQFNALRLNFSNATTEQIQQGLAILANLIKQHGRSTTAR